MAEWLGCPIDDLYAVLEAMGHKKIYDPADEKKEEESAADNVSKETGDASDISGAPEIAGDVQAEMAEGLAKQDEKSEEAPAQTANALEETPVVAVAPAAVDVKAEGDTLKTEEQKKPELATFRLKKGKANTKPYTAAKSYQKKPQAAQGAKQDGEKKDRSKGKRERRGNPKGKEYKKQTMTAEAKAKDDSPFAILEQLKKNADGKG
jgi:hypothetical protein